MKAVQTGMEPEKFLTHAEFGSLLKAAKDDRERCILLLLAGAGLQEVKCQDEAGKNRHRVHPHLLRHSFAVWSLDSGVPVGDLQDQLGHASLATCASAGAE
jgi:integrase